MNPITDLVIRIKNGYLARKEEVTSPYSTFREEVLKKLKELGYITDYEVSGDTIKNIRVVLAYPNEQPAVTNVKIFSKPGRRLYVTVGEIKTVLGGLGYSLISTPKGILSNKEAKQKKVGGELLFSIW